jgi:hypothetical protein
MMNSGHIEEISCRRLEQAFRAAFDDVVMMPNLVISLTNGHRLPTAEIDCTIVCNSGVFLFEIKGWSDAHVSREVVVGQEAKQWFLSFLKPGGEFAKTHKADPIVQGTEKHQEVRNRLPTCALLRSYVFLGGAKLTIDPDLPSNVITAGDLGYMVRILKSDTKRKKLTPNKPGYSRLDSQQVEEVAQLLRDMAKGNTFEEHKRSAVASKARERELSAMADAPADAALAQRLNHFCPMGELKA